MAIRYESTQFAALGIKLVIDYWQQRGHIVQVLLPDYCFNKQEVMLKKKLAVINKKYDHNNKIYQENKGDSLKNIPDNVDLLLDFKAKGIAFGIPNWNYDDSYMIEYAKTKGAFIITNDRYNDHIQNYSKNDLNKKKILKDWIRSHCMRYFIV